MSNLLDHIHEPADIKNLAKAEMRILAHEIRKELITTISVTGGHLGSNLGVVELTIALHKSFDSPKDQIIWDVGHQTYVHKILTGRRDALKTIRQYQGLSGFPKRSESVHDIFDTGHSSTSISAALGFAAARDIKGEDNYVVAVIGDGALSGGLAFEALNNAAHMKKNFIVVLNDNQMSIAKNVGAMSLYLDGIRTGNLYKEAKEDVQNVLKKIPRVGEGIIEVIRDLKDGIKQLVIPGMFFEEMGFTYLGPVDGHNLKQLTTTINQAKNVEGPVFIHVHTQKGKGYAIAEKHTECFHGTGPFDIKTGDQKSVSKHISYSKVFGDKLTSLAATNDKIVAITAGMTSGTGLNDFSVQYPERFFDVGIAEQHALTFSAGLSAAGFKPYVAIYSSFLQRGYDQVVHDIATQNLNVTICVDRAGLVGADGETHQGVFDVSFLNHIPNMTVIAPRCTQELELALDYSLTYTDGPLVIRYPRGSDSGHKGKKVSMLKHGKAEVLKNGNDIAVIFSGSMYQIAEKLVDELKAASYDCSLINIRFIKPLDRALIKKLAKKHKHIIVLEENAIIGGLGSEILRYISKEQLEMEVQIYGIDDYFVTHGDRIKLLKDCGLDVGQIKKNILKSI
ncbi:MAG: 1-deoxy-D-xylulose-5-phosphate synthase [Vallitaleaceae bacterium]|jgi:1-deoxy-D-xylulose-5-phosphate synthase|nr:1-deoxy-D-xylulose-5-phosphate synthase [Vallitaleaceae bacterium]